MQFADARDRLRTLDRNLDCDQRIETMSNAAPSRPPGVVELVVQPTSRLWTATLLGFGAAALGGSAMLVMGELALGMRQVLLDVLLAGGLP